MKELVQKLRDLTGAGVMECKKALAEAGGDLKRALEIIREQGVLIAEKKSERKTGAGILESYIHNGRVGVLLELRTETDFVARSEPFRNLARELTLQVSAMAPATPAALLEQAYIRDEAKKVGDIVKEVIAKVGENIKVERFVRYEL